MTRVEFEAIGMAYLDNNQQLVSALARHAVSFEFEFLLLTEQQAIQFWQAARRTLVEQQKQIGGQENVA